jgi:hypothetical protein
VDFFIKNRGRGAEFVENIWPVLDKKMAIEFFRRDQVRWNIYKKFVKLADRLLKAGLSEQIVQVNCLTGVEYFRKEAEKELLQLEHKRINN